jgi:hypothetical protein
MGSRSGLPYTPCKLFYDGHREVRVGDYLQTPAGSAYRVESVRQNSRRAYRRHLDVLRWPVDEIPKRARIHPLHWYPRKNKKGRTLASLRTV